MTLTVWDQNTDGGIAKAQDQLNEQFHQMYPNVTIKRTVESFSDLKTTLKLALSSNTPPDVVQANQGYPDMGAFVAAGMLRPMNDYAKLYGWDSYYPEALLKQNSFSSDGKTWQGDTLFGVSQTGEVVGIYYNRQLLSSLGLQAAKDAVRLELRDGGREGQGHPADGVRQPRQEPGHPSLRGGAGGARRRACGRPNSSAARAAPGPTRPR